MPELMESIHPTGQGHFGVNERGILALVNPDRLRRILSRMLDENEFFGPHGIRSISKFHEKQSICIACRRPGIPGRLSACRIKYRHVWRKLQLAGTCVDAYKPAD